MTVKDEWQKNLVRQVISYAVDHTVTAADRGQILNMNKATAIALTLPQDSAATIPIGTQIKSFQGGAGQLSFVAGTGATVVSETGNLTALAQYAMITAEKIAANTWLLSGAGLTLTSNVLDRDMSVNDVVNVATKTTVYSFTILAGKLGTNKQIVIDLAGDFFNNSGAARAITLEVKLGSTVLWADASGAMNASASRHPWTMQIKLAAGNATNVQNCTGFFAMSNVGATTQLGDLSAPPAAATGAASAFGGVAAEDSTTNLTFTVSITHATNNASLSFRRQQAIAYLAGEGQKGDTTVGPQGIAGTGTGTFPTSANSPQSGNYTLQSSDIGQRLAASSTVSQTITVPNQSTLAMSDGQMFGIHVSSTGAVTVAGGLGVTLHPATIVSSRQDGVIWVIRMDSSNNFLVLGDFA